MYPCGICGHPCKTKQGQRGHEQLRHSGGTVDSGSVDSQEAQLSTLSDPGPPAVRPRSAELEQRFIQTLDRLDQVPQAIEGLLECIGQIESSLDEDGELMDRLTNIDLTVSGLLDRLEESGGDSESEEAPEADLLRDPSSEPSVKPQGILAWVCGWDSDEELDVALREACPLIFPPEEENSSGTRRAG